MKTIQTHAYIKQQGRLILDIPDDIPLGEHKVVLVIDERQRQRRRNPCWVYGKSMERRPVLLRRVQIGRELAMPVPCNFKYQNINGLRVGLPILYIPQALQLL